MRLVRLVTSVFSIFLLVGISAIAQEEGTFDNDPITNPDANACFEGGSMDGKCDTEWEWICGWHLIRYEAGITTEDDFPGFCESLILEAPLPIEEPAVVSDSGVPAGPGCQLLSGLYVDFGSNYAVAVGASAYNDDACTSLAGINLGLNIVYTTGGNTDATAMCSSEFGSSLIIPAPDNPNVYGCL